MKVAKLLIASTFAAAGVGLLVVLARHVARASLVTMRFNGTVDLSRFGGPSSSCFGGDVTWDPRSSPVFQGVNFAYYPVQQIRLQINEDDYSGALVGSTVSVSELGEFGVMTEFSPRADVGSHPDDLDLFGGFLRGPASLFPGHALPTDLDFLASITGPNHSQFQTYVSATPPPDRVIVGGTFAASA